MADYPQSLEELREIPCPAPTASWTPISHYDAVCLCIESLKKTGYKITGNTFEVTGKTMYLFAALTVDHPSVHSPKQKPLIGLRSSLDQRFGYSLFTGDYTIIENQRPETTEYWPVYAFYNKLGFGRKSFNTAANLKKNLDTGCYEATMRLRLNVENAALLDKVSLSSSDLDSLLMDCIRDKILAPARVSHLLDLLEQPPNPAYAAPLSALKLEHLIGRMINSSTTMSKLPVFTEAVREKLLSMAIAMGANSTVASPKAPERLRERGIDDPSESRGFTR